MKLRKTNEITDFFICFIDGASRGNPGNAGIGIVIKDNKGKNIKEIKEYIGNNITNNVAEYTALLRLLNELIKMNIKKTIINLDSELIVKQIEGVYRAKDPIMKKFLSNIRKLEENFEIIKYNLIPRQKNKQADKLANIAINLAAK